MQPAKPRNDTLAIRARGQDSPRHSELMAAVGVAQGMAPIPVEGDGQALALFARTDRYAQARVQRRGELTTDAAKAAAARTSAQAEILCLSQFYDHDLLQVVRDGHDHTQSSVTATAQRHLHSAALDLSDAHAILSRVVMTQPTPAVVTAAGDVALKHRPGYNCLRAAVEAARALLANARARIPTQPTVPSAVTTMQGSRVRTG